MKFWMHYLSDFWRTMTGLSAPFYSIKGIRVAQEKGMELIDYTKAGTCGR